MVAGYSTGLILSNLLHLTFMSGRSEDDFSRNLRASSSGSGTVDDLMFMLDNKMSVVRKSNNTNNSQSNQNDSDRRGVQSNNENDKQMQDSPSRLVPTPELPQSRTPVSKIYLLGERNSGTKYISSLLYEAFHPFYDLGDDDKTKRESRFIRGIPVLDHKHMFRHDPLSQQELQALKDAIQDQGILFVLAVRSPCEWADAMYRTPWHMCPPSLYDETHNQTLNVARRLRELKSHNMTMKPKFYCPKGEKTAVNKRALDERHISRAAFFDMPWEDGMESAQAESRDDYAYDSVFALRRHKLSLMEQVLSVAMPLHRVQVVSLGHVELAPDLFISNLATEFGLSRNSTQIPNKRSPMVHVSPCLSDEEWAIALEHIDWDMEGRFGFHSMHCHLCEGEQQRKKAYGAKTQGRRNEERIRRKSDNVKANTNRNIEKRNLEKRTVITRKIENGKFVGTKLTGRTRVGRQSVEPRT